MDSSEDIKKEALNTDPKYTSCPYNTSHRILRARMQYHLVKCKRTVKVKPEDEKSICPFDATHHVNKEDFEEHVKTCPNRKIIDSEKYAIESEEKREEEPAAAYNLPDLPPCEENWDDPNEPTYTYDPTAHLENQPILRTMHGATKSERKAFRQVERMKMIQFNSGQPMDTEAAANAVGVSISNGKVIGRGRGQSRLPLGRGSTIGGKPVDLDKVVGDGVGHIVPCPVEAGPLRPPREASLALKMSRLGEQAATPQEEFPPLSPSTGAIRKVKQPVKPEGHSRDRASEGKPSTSNDKPRDDIDWWEQGDEGRKRESSGMYQPKENSRILEDYKEKMQNSRLAAKLGVLPKSDERDDDERARDFTCHDDGWQVQRRRGKLSRGGGFARRGTGRSH